MKKVLFAVFGVLLLSGGILSVVRAAEESANYFPLQNGAWWMFEGKQDGGKQVRVKFEITREQDGRFFFDMLVNNVKQTADGYFEIKDGYLEITQNGQTDKLLKMSPRVGDAWESGPNHKQVKVEKITDMEGRKDCVQVVCSLSGKESGAVWFAPEIGWVFMNAETDGKVVNQLRLIDWSGNYKGVK